LIYLNGVHYSFPAPAVPDNNTLTNH